MANLESLNYKSVSQMDLSEGSELIKSIRLSRRISVKKIKTPTTKTSRARTAAKQVTKKIDKNMALELLKMIG